MTISEIKRRTADTSPHFFSRKTLQFFGQTMRSFRVAKLDCGLYRISAPMFRRSFEPGHSWVKVGETVRFFDPSTNELLHKLPEVSQ